MNNLKKIGHTGFFQAHCAYSCKNQNSFTKTGETETDRQKQRKRYIQGVAEKSNPLTCFANSLATDYNFLMKLCIDIVCSYLHVTFKCYLIILKYDKVM